MHWIKNMYTYTVKHMYEHSGLFGFDALSTQ